MTKCICGHSKDVHPDTVCQEPTNRCECQQYVELCPVCQHAEIYHGGGFCSRVVVKTKEPCGCTYYPQS